MAQWRPVALSRCIPASKPDAEATDLLPFYDESGKVFTIMNQDQLKNLISNRTLYDHFAGNYHPPSFPIKLELNVPWSLPRHPGKELQPQLMYAIMCHAMQYPICDTVSQVWGATGSTSPSEKCLFSRMCATVTPPTPPLLRLHQEQIANQWDTVALFRKPVLVSYLTKAKETRDIGQGKERQYWMLHAACTNCIVAKVPQTCLHSQTAMATRKMGHPVKTRDVEKGGHSDLDRRCHYDEVLYLDWVFGQWSWITVEEPSTKPLDVVLPR